MVFEPISAAALSFAAYKFVVEQVQRKQNLSNASTQEHTIAHIDDVYCVLSVMGEKLEALEILNDGAYSTISNVIRSAMAHYEDIGILEAFDKLDEPLRRASTAGLAFCAAFYPVPVYRGFGAGLYESWDWGCPKLTRAENETKAGDAGYIHGIFGKVKTGDTERNDPILLAFDQVIMAIKNTSISFLKTAPTLGIQHQIPRYEIKAKEEVNEQLPLLKEWTAEFEKHGFPGILGTTIESWDIPFATWDSQFSYQLQNRSWDDVVKYEMDPGRLLYAFLCCSALDLDDEKSLILPRYSAAESLSLWLEGLPRTTHQVLSWQDRDTTEFEQKISDGFKRRLNHPCLPKSFVVKKRQITISPQARSSLYFLKWAVGKGRERAGRLMPQKELTSPPPPYTHPNPTIEAISVGAKTTQHAQPTQVASLSSSNKIENLQSPRLSSSSAIAESPQQPPADTNHMLRYFEAGGQFLLQGYKIWLSQN